MKQILAIILCCLIYSAQAQTNISSDTDGRTKKVKGYIVSKTAKIDTTHGMLNVKDYSYFSKFGTIDSAVMIESVHPTIFTEDDRPISNSSHDDFFLILLVLFAIAGPLPTPLIKYIAKRQLEKELKKKQP